jgi:hypothetical protein
MDGYNTMSSTVKIDGKDHDFDALSDLAKQMYRNVRTADARLAQLRQEAGMIQLARDVYAKTLAENLPKPATN